MPRFGILSVDLNKVNSEQREVFNDELRKRNWGKLVPLTTVWTTYWAENQTEQTIIQTAQTHVAAAARAASITAYDAVAGACDSQPTVWKVAPQRTGSSVLPPRR